MTLIMCIRNGYWLRVEKAPAGLRDMYGGAIVLIRVDERTGRETTVELDGAGARELATALLKAADSSAFDYRNCREPSVASAASSTGASDPSAPGPDAPTHGRRHRDG